MESTTALTRFEEAALRMFTAGCHPVLETLRTQLSSICVAERSLTGVGFFTSFRVDRAAPCLGGGMDYELSDVAAEVAGCPGQIILVLFVRAGTLDALEACTTFGDWPRDIASFRLFYLRGESVGGELSEVEERDLGWTFRA